MKSSNKQYGKRLLILAFPIIMNNIIAQLQMIIDRIFLGHANDLYMSALGNVSSPVWTTMSFCNSLVMGASILISQSVGAKKREDIGEYAGAMLKYNNIIPIFLCFFWMIFPKPVFMILGVSDNVMPLCLGYVRWYAPLFLLTGLGGSLGVILQTSNYTKPLVVYGCVRSGLNIFLDWMLIFGNLGMPALGIKGAAIATVLAQIIAFVICWIYMIKRYELLRLSGDDFKEPQPQMIQSMLSAGLSMGFMSSLINIGSLTLQTAINKLGQNIIVAHTAARKISEMFMIMFTVFGQTMATYCGQNLGAGRIDRIKKGIGLAILYTCIWCSFTIVASYTIGDWLVYMVTGSKNAEVLKNATNYLKFDTLFYFVTAVICVVRNAMQGLGDHITPLVSSSLEMIGKIVIAATLVPWFGYTGVIVAEPLVWFIMVIPLLIQIFRMPVLKNNILTKS